MSQKQFVVELIANTAAHSSKQLEQHMRPEMDGIDHLTIIPEMTRLGHRTVATFTKVALRFGNEQTMELILCGR